MRRQGRSVCLGHDLRRSFGTRWAGGHHGGLMQLMRNEHRTTKAYYIDRGRDEIAEDLPVSGQSGYRFRRCYIGPLRCAPDATMGRCDGLSETDLEFDPRPGCLDPRTPLSWLGQPENPRLGGTRQSSSKDRRFRSRQHTLGGHWRRLRNLSWAPPRIAGRPGCPSHRKDLQAALKK